MNNKIMKASLDLNWLKTQENYTDKEVAKTFLELKEDIINNNNKFGFYYVSLEENSILQFDIGLKLIKAKITNKQIKEARYNNSIITLNISILDIIGNEFLDDVFDENYILDLGLILFDKQYKIYIKNEIK